MIGQSEASVEDVEDGADDGSGKQRSTIGFPYMNLDDAVAVAHAIHNNVGPGECDDDQLAAWLKLSPKSSGYRTRVYTTRMFGLIEDKNGSHALTALGRSIVDANQARSARVTAFLRVPLYKSVFDRYRGTTIPPAAAFEKDIVSLGVAEKQKGRARQVFEKSAEQAGFFEQGRDRLVKPGVPDPKEGSGGSEGSKASENEKGGGSGGGEPPKFDLHPFIQGLLQTLPKPDTEWPGPARAKWLQTAANIFDLIYKGDGGIEVRTATASRSPRPND